MFFKRSKFQTLPHYFLVFLKFHIFLYILYFLHILYMFTVFLIVSLPTNATRRNHFSTLFQFFTKITNKSLNNNYFPYLFLPKGDFDIDAGDGGGGGTIQDRRFLTNQQQTQTKTTKIPKHHKQIINTGFFQIVFSKFLLQVPSQIFLPVPFFKFLLQVISSSSFFKFHLGVFLQVPFAGSFVERFLQTPPSSSVLKFVSSSDIGDESLKTSLFAGLVR